MTILTCSEKEAMKIRDEKVKRCVVLLSGGLDSTVLMYSLVNDYEVWPITLSYGQKHAREVIAARNVCESRDHNLLLRWKYVNLDILRSLLPSALTGKGEVPHGHYQEESMRQTVVPGRNLILLAVAAGYAEGLGASAVAYAAHSGDHFIYPDCRPEFVESVKESVKLGTDGKVGLLVPFERYSKADIVRLGASLNVPFGKTWTCYEGGDVHCGLCGSCNERREAFWLAGVKDPTVYIAKKLGGRK